MKLDDLPPFPVTAGVEYRHIPGFPGYCAGGDGSVWSCRSRNGRGGFAIQWRRREPYPNQGYLCVTLMLDRKPVYRSVHTLVLVSFIGPCPEGMEACHNDGNRTNNYLSNLRWDLRINNHADKEAHGTKLLGTMHCNAKLTDDGVRTIRRLVSDGVQKKIVAERFGVSSTVVYSVSNRRTWKHVPD